jgi:hypothetical protein
VGNPTMATAQLLVAHERNLQTLKIEVEMLR